MLRMNGLRMRVADGEDDVVMAGGMGCKWGEYGNRHANNSGSDPIAN